MHMLRRLVAIPITCSFQGVLLREHLLFATCRISPNHVAYTPEKAPRLARVEMQRGAVCRYMACHLRKNIHVIGKCYPQGDKWV